MIENNKEYTDLTGSQSGGDNTTPPNNHTLLLMIRVQTIASLLLMIAAALIWVDSRISINELTTKIEQLSIVDVTVQQPTPVQTIVIEKEVPIAPIIEENIIEETIIVEETIVEEIVESISVDLDVPKGPTNMFCFMDYKKLTNKTSSQYRFQRNENVYTNEYGIRTYKFEDKEYYMAALGEAYGLDKGLGYLITLDNGHEFYIVSADTKGGVKYGHKCKNYDGQETTNVIEFIVDIDKISKRTKDLGTFSYQNDILPQFNGNIKRIEMIGKVWYDGIDY